MKSSRARILCIADVPNWIFHRHIDYLRRYLSDEFEILTAFHDQAFIENDYDLIYPIEFMLIEPDQITDPRKYVTGIRSFISWAVEDFLALTDVLRTRFRRVHVVSRELYNIFAPYLPGLDYVTHGVDLELFTPHPSLSNISPDEPPKLRIGWAGNRFTPVKGFREYIAPVGEIPGVELAYHGFADKNLTIEQMPAFYQEIDVYVCASSFEGNNNSLLEAAAMERAIITTPVGTVGEYLEDQRSALIVERDLTQFIVAVSDLRDHPEKRTRLGKQARQSLVDNGWDWKNKAEEYRRFFRRALEDTSDLDDRKAQEPSGISINNDHLLSVLRAQHACLREIHIGDRILLWEESHNRELLEHDLAEIRASESYLFSRRLFSSGPMQALARAYNRMAHKP